MQTQKDLELFFRLQFLYIIFWGIFSIVIWHKLAKFPSYSVKCISCFMLRNLVISWNLKTYNSKIWFSWERKELLTWNKIFFLVWPVPLLIKMLFVAGADNEIFLPKYMNSWWKNTGWSKNKDTEKLLHYNCWEDIIVYSILKEVF